jgi:hypothetical protein
MISVQKFILTPLFKGFSEFFPALSYRLMFIYAGTYKLSFLIRKRKPMPLQNDFSFICLQANDLLKNTYSCQKFYIAQLPSYSIVCKNRKFSP